MKKYYSILGLVILVVMLYLLFNYIIIDECDCCKEGFNISNSKLISNNLTTKQCQNFCINTNNCHYTNRLKSKDLGERQPCWISTGFGEQKILPGGTKYETWENEKYKPSYLTKIKNMGTKLYGGGGWDPNILKRNSNKKKCHDYWRDSWYRGCIRYRYYRPSWPWYCRPWYIRRIWWARRHWRCRARRRCINYGWKKRKVKGRRCKWIPKKVCSGEETKDCYRKLRKGEGDCDRDSDCQGKLRCFHNVNRGVEKYGISSKGVSGGFDVCYDPNDYKHYSKIKKITY